MSPQQASSKQSRGARGFTLVETLVALVLLSVGLIPAFVLANSAIVLASTVRNRLVATSLAQEGVEMVHAIRDANWLAGPPTLWDAGLSGPPCDTGCRVEWNKDTVLMPAGNPTLKLDPVTGMYSYLGPNDSGFTRQIIITKDPAFPNRRKVVVTMGWKERSGNKTLALEYYLYNWLQ